MGETMKRIQQRSVSSRRPQRGFTLVEVMIAIAIMSVGLLALVGVFGTALSASQMAQENLIARQKALEAMESIYTARNAQQINFAQIANISSGGIFTSAPTAMNAAGPDGLVNTADDVSFPGTGVCPAGPECVVMPGPDGILGNADDVAMSLGNFTRQIVISTVNNSDGTINPNLKKITVTVTYARSGSTNPISYSVNGLISSFR